MTGDAVRQVMWPKIGGSQVLHDAFPPGSVDFFYLTASAAGIFGIPGQGSYAAANSYLDAAGAPATGLPHHEPRLGSLAGARIGRGRPARQRRASANGFA
ncbi:Malonyl CoA-acyl carrier protein transacylase [Mycobacterium tuberculosis]|uniref:Malonyl CoA-acyl carrier protein transacylase n=1 Tax=Mycobacterium tuberculosis TaxID=1773 RepID=A0A654U7E3_MYCTX|nr:Malonyl CoA-acyl carrier protein transacylase [Mycobacterium tuberculosis]